MGTKLGPAAVIDTLIMLFMFKTVHKLTGRRAGEGSRHRRCKKATISKCIRMSASNLLLGVDDGREVGILVGSLVGSLVG